MIKIDWQIVLDRTIKRSGRNFVLDVFKEFQKLIEIVALKKWPKIHASFSLAINSLKSAISGTQHQPKLVDT